MRLYFGGAEIGSHRTILEDAGVKNVAMSYMGLRRRVKFAKPWLISEKFPHKDMGVFLDSGAYTVNAEDENFDPDELIGIAEHYQEFVTQNIDRVDMVTEFDAMPLGIEWIEEQREQFWSTIPREKFMAVWHPVWGISYLNEMAAHYEIIGIPATSLEGRNLRPVLNALASKGTRLHGIAMTRVEEMQTIRWDSVASTSWISPQRYGDTIVWTGNELKRYPMKYKQQARRRHRSLFKDKGFNSELIEADDPTEVLRLSVWSWQQFEGYVNKKNKSGNVVTPLFSNGTPPREETEDEVVDTPDETDDISLSTPEPTKALAVRREANLILPVMGFGRGPEEDEDKPPTITIRSESSRVCNTCFLAEKCPGYQPDSNCVYNIPIQIRTREQLKALREGMIEMQAQRVLFMRMAEEVEGGYADPNLTKEMTLLNKMIDEYETQQKEGFSISINARGGSAQAAESGMISRIFGSNAGQQVQQIESFRADDIIDAELGEDK